jgi:hypothetical protein
LLFDPRDKAELYAILQGRIASAAPAETNGSHAIAAAGDQPTLSR